MLMEKVIEELRKNPKLNYRAIDSFGDRHEMSISDTGYFYYRKFRKDGYFLDPNKHSGGHFNGNINATLDWQLVREPVPVWEAIKAYCEGKKVYCVFKMFGEKEGKFYLNNSDDWVFRGNLLTEGKWFVEDNPNG